MNIIIGIVAILILWSVWGYFGSRVEQAAYTVTTEKSGYEIRNYPAHIVAQTTVAGPYRDALNQGFRIVAGYIFGGNTKKESIAMTAPVSESSGGSEKVAMTAPVLATMEGESHVISFGMPRSYTLETLPTPTDSRVKLVEIPEKKMAVLRFSWLRTDERVMEKKAELLALLKRDNMEIVGSPIYAGYNAPWTPPWLTRHEVMVEVK
jgi:hypothetical protein